MISYLRLTAWLITRRPRMAWAACRYRRRMAKLHREYVPVRRRRHLDIMAMRAEDISGFERREPQTQEWGVTSEILCAAAASEYGQILSDLCLTSDSELWDSTPAQVDTWDALWTEMTLTRGDRAARAGIYRELGDLTAGATGTAVLYELAASELAARRRNDTAGRRRRSDTALRRVLAGALAGRH
jgi:hypothetical protein